MFVGIDNFEGFGLSLKDIVISMDLRLATAIAILVFLAWVLKHFRAV